jgi:hypothetical protein
LGIEDAVIYAKSGKIFKGYSVSPVSGYYKIDKLPYGNYELIVDRIGYWSNNRIVSLNNSNLENINFTLQNYLIGVAPPGGNIPENYSLSQNFPNPFNPITEINFGLPTENFVKLVIFDIQGREIEVLANDFFKPGNHKVVWNASGNSSGIYFCKMTSVDFIRTIKLVLVK